MTPHFLFVHGWAMDATFWDAIRGDLGARAGSVRELGYFDPPARARLLDLPPPDAPIIGVGHSLGVMQLLGEPPAGLVGLVAVNGFTRFTRADDHPAGVPAQFLHRMMRRLDQDAAAVAAAFRARCGLAGMPPGRALAPVLGRGLALLRDGDLRHALGRVPHVLALAATRDEIVPAALSAACFGEPHWVEADGHLLPLTHAALCADMLREFAGRFA